MAAGVVAFFEDVIAKITVLAVFLPVVAGQGGNAGAAIPLTMKKLGINPAQSSSIILTTVTDILGFFAFPGFAVLFQNQLI